MYKSDVENDGFLALKLSVAMLIPSCGALSVSGIQLRVFGLKIALRVNIPTLSQIYTSLCVRAININYIVVEFWFDKPTYHGYFWLSKREFTYPLEPAFFSFTVETVSERTGKTTTCVQKSAILIEERDC